MVKIISGLLPLLLTPTLLADASKLPLPRTASADGDSRFAVFDFPEELEASDQAHMFISGEAAALMFAEMTDVELVPGKYDDYRKVDPKKVNLADLPRKVGQSFRCIKRPETNKDGSWHLDKKGEVVITTVCLFDVDAKKGAILPESQD